jgi:hypothetical protein
MSCLYSSPEVISLELLALQRRKLWRVASFGLSWSWSLRRSGMPYARARNRRAVQFHANFVVRRDQQRRVPQQSSRRRRLHQIIPPAKASTGFSREFSSAISGFRSLCGRKQRSSLSHRAQLDLRFGTFHSGRALALRTLASTRNIPKRYLRGQ